MKIALGSAQFGLDYGLKNKRGKISKEEVFKIIEKAMVAGVEIIDTAKDYGNSHEIIGKFIINNPNFSKIKIVSKINCAEYNKIESDVNSSLDLLNVNKLYGLLVHDFNQYIANPKIWNEFIRLKREKKSDKIGFSLYYPKELKKIIDDKLQVDIIQIPFNIFDQRFSKYLPLLKQKGVEIHARSAFMQGLFFKEPEKLDKQFVLVKDKIKKIKKICHVNDFSLSHLCINYVNSKREIDVLIIGVDNIKNLEENLNFNKIYLTEVIMKELDEMQVNDENIIIPSNWNQDTIKKVGEFYDGDRIFIRELTEDDASEEYVNWINDFVVNEHLETKETTKEELRRYIIEKNEKSNCKFFGIFVKKETKHIGNVKIETINHDIKKGTFGIIIGNKKYWDKGFGSEATRLILDYGFKKLDLNRIDLGVVKKNISAVKAYEKVGFSIVDEKNFGYDNKSCYIMEISKNEFYKKSFDEKELIDTDDAVMKYKKQVVCAIIQARMGSVRFPGKMMADISGKTVICHVIYRVKKSKLIDKVVLATSIDENDDVLELEAKKMGINVFRGSEDDVLDRFYWAAKKCKATTIVRITGDCPLIDPNVIDHTINFFNTEKCDFATNTDPPTFPDGMDVEVFSFNALEQAWKNAKLKSEREHVTPYIRNNKDLFKIKNIENNQDFSEYRITLDEKEDLIVIKKILEKLSDKTDYSLLDIIKILKSNKKITKINKKYERNEGYKKSQMEDERIKS